MPRYTSKHTGKKIDDTIDNVSNPNLLDNWYFGNPVDQRQGLLVPPGTTYNKAIPPDFPVAGTATKYIQVRVVDTHGSAIFSDPNGGNFDCFVPAINCVRGYTGSGHTIDRWINAGTDKTVLIKDDGLYFPVASDFFSNLDKNLYGETVTYSVLTDKGLISATGTIPNAAPSTITEVATGTVSGIGRISMYARDPSSAPVTFHVSFFFDAGVTAIAAKLELGDHQTLAHQDANGNWQLNEIPDYGEQLARCQRYQFVPHISSWTSYQFTFMSGSLVGIIPFPVTMRTIPSVVLTGKQLRNNAKGHTITLGAVESAFKTKDALTYMFGVSSSDGTFVEGDQYSFLEQIIFDANL